MGAVYAARDDVVGRDVAVKVLGDGLAADATARARFSREIRTAALLGLHPHVVTVHDAGEWQGRPYLVMELLAGSVGERLRTEGPPPPSIALRWLAQTADALDAAHERGVVHRDVKPANLLLDEAGNIRLADFGVVRGETTGGNLTLSGEVVGTPGYVAPEVVRGAPATPASDVYSLAVVARELLGDHPALPRALSQEPRDRPGSCSALAAALAGQRGETLVARPAATARLRRHRSVRIARAVTLIAAVAAAAFAGGAYVTTKLVPGHEAAAPRPAKPAVTCAVSPLEDDANIVVAGVGAAAFCRSQAHVLRLHGDDWTYRLGRELYAPHHGLQELAVVCRLSNRRLRVTVYDDGSRSIGRDVCAWYGSGGWNDSAA